LRVRWPVRPSWRFWPIWLFGWVNRVELLIGQTLTNLGAKPSAANSSVHVEKQQNRDYPNTEGENKADGSGAVVAVIDNRQRHRLNVSQDKKKALKHVPSISLDYP
jgi:hypothetical protein